MFFRILQKDLKRKKTMNLIVLVFIILAATFIASSVNNMLAVTTSLDTFFEKANVPDHWFAVTDDEELSQFSAFAEEEKLTWSQTDVIQVDTAGVLIDGEAFDYPNSLCLSSPDSSLKIFDENDREITYVAPGDIYISAEQYYSGKNDFSIGSQIELPWGDGTKTFTLRGATKDALFGSSMIGMTRFLINEEDLADYNGTGATKLYSVCVFTDDPDYRQHFMDLGLSTIMDVNRSSIKLMYVMNMLIAGVLLVVSICLILISMMILRFTIQFTISEEFREIGVMKALGIPCRSIRSLYIVKYLAISTVGAAVGFVLSIPLGTAMLREVSLSMIMGETGGFLLNLLCAAATAAIVAFFCYICTRKIRTLSPIDAIRNGQSGERFTRKRGLKLHRSKLPTVVYLALNDIASSMRRYLSMLVIFTLGLLLIILPVNTINTLSSDSLLYMFGMTGCDHVISRDLLVNPQADNEKLFSDRLEEVRQVLSEHDIEADVFQEAMFRLNISYQGKSASSIALQGIGGVTTDEYAYTDGTAPVYRNEVALTGITADAIGAGIGDDVEITIGPETKTYTVTALYQSMNNLGEGIRFCQDEELDYTYVAGNFGIQIRYRDDPDRETLAQRLELLEDAFPDTQIFSAGDYISYMIGDVAGQLDGVRQLILLVVLGINILVTMLMVRSFLLREKSQIAILKAMGFRDSSLMAWQSLRIGFVLLLSIILAAALSTPLTHLCIAPIFRMMGAYSVTFEIRPLEVYVFYPLLILCATLLTALLSALWLRRIRASETAAIE